MRILYRVMIEIERKYLVNSSAYKKEATSKTYMVQGFLNTHPDRTVRIRLKGEQGFLTVKGRSSKDGTTRFEWETQLLTQEAQALLPLCEKGIIEKHRYEIPVGNHLFEVDEFMGSNEGLVLAEIELNHATEVFTKPSWLGQEVTGQNKYYNSQLSKSPFKSWKK